MNISWGTEEVNQTVELATRPMWTVVNVDCMEKNTNVALQMDIALKKRQENNMVILESIVKTVIICGRQNLGLRGDRDDSQYLEDETRNCGNFQALLDFRIDSGDQMLEKHFETAPKNATYRSKTVQNEMMEIIGEMIQRKIVTEIEKAGGWFSISANEVRDVFNKEQLPICARYSDENGIFFSLNIYRDLIMKCELLLHMHSIILFTSLLISCNCTLWGLFKCFISIGLITLW